MTTVEFCNACQHITMALELAQDKQAPSTKWELLATARDQLTKLLDACVQEMRVDED